MIRPQRISDDELLAVVGLERGHRRTVLGWEISISESGRRRAYVYDQYGRSRGLIQSARSHGGPSWESCRAVSALLLVEANNDWVNRNACT